VDTAQKRIVTARLARESAEQQLAGEQKLYDVGRSTTFLLLQRQTELTTARTNELQAETDYSKALADLQRATSATLRVNNVVVQNPVQQP
jgi:HAE1 family hydrophobic/amphiphilic exporter-1